MHPWRADAAQTSHLSLSLVNAQNPSLYTTLPSPGFVGMVYESSEASLREMFALLPTDGHTDTYTCMQATAAACQGAHPSAVSRGLGACYSSPLQPPTWGLHQAQLDACLAPYFNGTTKRWWACYYEPSALKLMMQQQSLLLGGKPGPFLQLGPEPQLRTLRNMTNEQEAMWHGYNDVDQVERRAQAARAGSVRAR